MAGLTAYIAFENISHSLSRLLSDSLQASYPLPEMKTVLVQTGTNKLAIGGTFPKHFQRDNEIAQRGDNTLLFYGELYNKLDGKCEVEFVLQMIRENGLDCLKDLNGPFIFFLWDGFSQELKVVTDRLGRFPAFISVIGNLTVVSTDLHGIFTSGILKPELKEQSVIDFLNIGFPLGDQSFFKNIERITGGEVLTFSSSGLKRYRYWEPRFTNTLHNCDELVNAFQFCNNRALKKANAPVITLSGGWDSRSTCAAASALNVPIETVTFGVKKSTDVEVASSVAGALNFSNILLEPQHNFFSSFHEWADKVIILSQGHATIDLAFQIYLYDRMSKQFPAVLDSAGCEFRRGIRAKRTLLTAKHTGDITRFLLSMYSTGIWNNSIIEKDFFHAHASITETKLTQWLDSLTCSTYDEKIDTFFYKELWAHSYAHGYPLQTDFIACRMPFSDNEFYDLFLQSSKDIRWSHKFHRSVINKFAPKLKHIPISYGHCKVPYGESVLYYLPVIYHKLILNGGSKKGLLWLKSFDNYRPFRPYNQWYCNELEGYISDMLDSSIASTGYFNIHGVRDLLNAQKTGLRDYSHRINILLTLTHLVQYIKSFQYSAKVVV